jgi:hypothetical protein
MSVIDKNEIWDRLTLLLIAQPSEGWEDIFAEITRREVERLAPHPQLAKSPAVPAGPNNGSKGG